jgi:TonB family protein
MVIVVAAQRVSLAAKEQTWIELRSPNFVVVTNASEKQARRVAYQFELVRAVFQEFFRISGPSKDQPLIIVAAKDEDTLKTLLPEYWSKKGSMHPAGIYFAGPEKNYVGLRLDVSMNQSAYEPYEPVYHEYVHYLTRRLTSRMPLWLVEGLAEFYGNLRIESKKVYVGAPSTSNLMLLRQKVPMPLSTLFDVNASSPYYHEENKASIFYAESWALTHYLIARDLRENTQKVNDFLAVLGQNVTPADAARRTIGDPASLDGPLSRYIHNFTFVAARMEAPASVDESGFVAQSISEAESLAVRADFMVHDRHYSEAQAMLEESLKLDPKLAAACESMGFLYFQQGKTAEAGKWYSEAIALNAQSYFANYFYALNLLKGKPGDDWAAKAETSLRTALKINPDFAAAYNALAYLLALATPIQKPEEAYTMALHAAQLEPGNVHYRITGVQVLERLGRGEDAIRVAHLAVSMSKTSQEEAEASAALSSAQQFQAYQNRAENFRKAQPSSEPLSTQTAQSTPSTTEHKPEPITAEQKQSESTPLGAGPIEVLSDTMGVDFGPYLQRIVHDVRENWYNVIPEIARPPIMKQGKLAIEFAVLKDGRVAGMKMVATSGDVGLDRAAWSGITNSNPFPPLPTAFGGQYIALRFFFYYNPDRKLLEGSNENAKKTEVGSSELNRGRAALRSGNYPMAIQLLKQALELDPKSEEAWNNLGLAYLADHRIEDAITAFKKQINVSHDGVYAYNNLGRAYWKNRQYEDAEAAFRKQLQVNPLDNFAGANLGGLYLECHKYNEAAMELEKATSMKPDNANLQVNLGTAYLNLGQDEKAMAAFNLAVKLSATPRVWNNIAYQLALRKSHLDLAQQYARSAVTTTSAALHALNLDHLSADDLSLVSALGSYWDTLGWVYFANDDLEKAEKYVASAWRLTENSTDADHLGQIYQKRGEKDKAIKAYALAMDGYRTPDPETRQRLSALVGGDDRAVAETTRRRDDLSAQRTVRLPATGPANASGDFFVLLAPSTPGAKRTVVEAVKFIRGDERLKVMEGVLSKEQYGVTFPEDTLIKVVRRGTLSCSSSGECGFVMMLPEDVKSTN